jgi:lipopolysaccharide export system protein LptA
MGAWKQTFKARRAASGRLRMLLLASQMTLAQMMVAEASNASPAFATEPDAPIEIAAQQISVLELDNKAILTGKAFLEQGALRLSAQNMTLIFNPAKGHQAEQIFAKDEVVMVDAKGQTSRADQAHYDLSADLLTMTGNVQVKDTQADGQFTTLRGQRLVINMRDGSSQMQSDPSTGRVRIDLNQ